jgi:hypothetical protein
MTTTNNNMLSPVGFSFQIKKTPNINFFVQSVTLPGITLGQIDVPNQLKVVPVPGDHITYGDLDVTFKINEDMSNYLEIFSWITALGFPDNPGQYRSIEQRPSFSGDGIYSDASLTILSSAMNPSMRVEITDAFPTSLTPITLDTRDTSIEYIEATVSFRFLNYTFKRLR